MSQRKETLPVVAGESGAELARAASASLTDTAEAAQ